MIFGKTREERDREYHFKATKKAASRFAALARIAEERRRALLAKVETRHAEREAEHRAKRQAQSMAAKARHEATQALDRLARRKGQSDFAAAFHRDLAAMNQRQAMGSATPDKGDWAVRPKYGPGESMVTMTHLPTGESVDVVASWRERWQHRRPASTTSPR